MLMKLVATDDNELYIEDAEDLAERDDYLNSSQALLMMFMIKVSDQVWVDEMLDDFAAHMAAQEELPTYLN